MWDFSVVEMSGRDFWKPFSAYVTLVVIAIIGVVLGGFVGGDG